MGGSGRGELVPSSSKKIIQSLKEIVNCPDTEIYSVLQDCNMDPNEAVNHLLSQDPFHEVKSRREKKKENKDLDSRPRGSNSTSTRGGRGAVDRYSSRNSASLFVSSDYASSHGKAPYKNGPTGYANSTMGTTENNVKKRQTVSDGPTNSTILINGTEAIAAAPQSSAYQSAWSNTSGQVSVADIVKMGRPQLKVATSLNASQQHVNSQHVTPSLAASFPCDTHTSQNYASPSQVPEVNRDSGLAGWQDVPTNNEWEPPAASVSSNVEPLEEPYSEPYDRTNQQYRSQADDVQFEEDSVVDDEHATFVESVSGTNQNIHEDISGSTSGFDNELYQNIVSNQVLNHEAEDRNVSVSSVTNDFQNLSLPKEDEEAPLEEEGPGVKIPDHLQVHNTDFSHLSFGSFGSAMNVSLSGSFTLRTARINEDEATAASDTPSLGHSEVRNPEYHEEDYLRTKLAVNNGHRISAGAGSFNFEAPSVSQPDMLKHEASEVAQANQYNFPSATLDVNNAHRLGTGAGSVNFEVPSISQPDILKHEASEVAQANEYPFPLSTHYDFENVQQLNSSFDHSTPKSQVQGLPSLASDMPYSNSLPASLMVSNMHPVRDAELGYSQFPISQSVAAKYGHSISSINLNASMAEALKASNFSAPQPAQTPAGGSISGATALPQRVAVHPYSQHSLPVGPLNLMGYPFMHQSFAYVPPSAFQQAFAAGNTTYPQSLSAAVLPQYKNSVSVNSLLESGAVGSGYGSAFGNSSNVPSNFPLNLPTVPAGTSMNYEDFISSQYKEANHRLSLQQGPGSRAMSGVPGSAYYSFHGQNQEPAGYHQSQQQQSQHYGPLSGNSNYYQSQGGLSLEQQQQMARDGTLGSSQGQQPKQTNQQFWQNSY